MNSELEEKLAKVRNYSSSGLENQKQLGIVLQAVEDVLREQNTECSPTAYFGILLSLLHDSCSQGRITNQDLAAAVVYLLDLIAPSTPSLVHRTYFERILKILVPALADSDAHSPLVRSSVGVLEVLLKSQDGASWTSGLPVQAMRALLGICLDSRPKVRKRAQGAVGRILCCPPPPALDHPVFSIVSDIALNSVQQLIFASGKNKTRDARGIHSLQLVITIASNAGWPPNRMEKLCDILFKIAKNCRDEYLTLAAFEVFSILFGRVLKDLDGAKLIVILDSLVALRPPTSDYQLHSSWMHIVALGFSCLAKIDQHATVEKLPDVFNLLCPFLQSDNPNTRTSAGKALVTLVDECVPLHSTAPEISKIIETITGCFEGRFSLAIREILVLCISVLNRLGKSANPCFLDVLRKIGNLRMSERFDCKGEVDSVIATAIRGIGPEVILSILPLNLEGTIAGEPGRAWMLPLLRDNISNANLGHFIEELVPLSERFFAKLTSCNLTNKTNETKLWEILVEQIWNLLPGYCDLPRDFSSTFTKPVAELLATVLTTQENLRAVVCKSLQNLVEKNKALLESEVTNSELKNSLGINKQNAKENINLLSSYASQFLAVLFNVFNQTPACKRGFLLNCIGSFLTITSDEEITSTFVKVNEMLAVALSEHQPTSKLSPSDVPPPTYTLMDIVITLTPVLPLATFDTLWNVILPVIHRVDDSTLQKKSYKVLCKLCESKFGKIYMSEKIGQVQKVLEHNLDEAVAIQKDRLLFISHVISILPVKSVHLIPALLPEIILGTKEQNEKARNVAYDLLVQMGNKMKEGGIVANSKMDIDSETTIEEYFTMVAAGLSGENPHVISATITSLSRLLFEFHGTIRLEFINELVETMDVFITSRNREIARAALGFYKVAIISLPSQILEPKLKALLINLMTWSHEHKGHFKAKVKHLLERMIRKFGLQTIESHLPEEDRKLLIHVRKARDRRKKKKNSRVEQGGDGAYSKQCTTYEALEESSLSESELSDDSPAYRKQLNHKNSKIKRYSEAYIQEDKEEPLNLLDSSAFTKISSTKPSLCKGNKPSIHCESSLKSGPDSRLIIGDAVAEQRREVDITKDSVDKSNGGKKKARNRHVRFSNKRGRDDDVEMEDANIAKASNRNSKKVKKASFSNYGDKMDMDRKMRPDKPFKRRG